MKRICLALAIIATSITTHAQTIIPQTNYAVTNIDTTRWQANSKRNDSQGSITFFQSLENTDSGFTRTFKNGKSFSYLSTSNGQYAGLGDINTQTLVSLKNEKNSYGLPENDVIKPANTLKAQVNKYRYKPSLNVAHSNLEIEDTDIAIAMVLDSMAIKIAMERGETLGLSLDEQLQAAIDITNLALVNSGITAFTVSLGAVITMPTWTDAQALQAAVYGDTVQNDIGFAMLQGKADRVAFFVDPDFTGTFLGLAKQWYFKDDNENLGILNTSFDDRTMQISARVLVTDVLAHEFGHTLGLGHERATQFDTVDFAIPYGYTSPNGIVSIMSYGNECLPNCQAFPTLYSNPNVSQDGFAIGVPESEENAADAASFINRTWPMTTQASYNLTPVDVKHFATSTTVFWTPPANLDAQTLYISHSSCPDVPSPYEKFQIAPTVESNYEVISLSGDTSTYALTDAYANRCIIIVGEFTHEGASLQRAIGMVSTGINNDSDRFNLSTNLVEVENGIAQFEMSLANTSATNNNFIVQVPDISEYNNRLAHWRYVNLDDSALADIITADIQGDGAARNVLLSIDEYRLLDFIKQYGLYGNYMTGRIPLRITAVNEGMVSLASQYFYLNVRAMVEAQGSITVSANALSFKDKTSKPLVVTFSDVTDPNALSAMRFVNGELTPIEKSQYTVNKVSDSTYEIRMNVVPPTTDNEALVFSTNKLPISMKVQLFRVTWPYIANTSNIPAALPRNTYSTFGITIANPSLSDTTSFTVGFGSSCTSDREVIKRNDEPLANGDLYFSLTVRSDIVRNCTLGISRFEGNSGWQIFETDIAFVDSVTGLGTTAFDFNGDKAADLAIWQDSAFIARSSVGGAISRLSVSQDNIEPLVGDFDGDQLTDFGYYSTNGEFAFWDSKSQYWRTINVATGNVEPNVGDFDGNGKDDFAVRNRDTGLWTIYDVNYGSQWQTVFGNQPGDMAVVADYDGDGIDDFAVRRTTSRQFIIKESSTGKIKREYFGSKEEDLPVVADYDGDGKADIAVRRLSRKQWYIKYSSNNKIYRTGFGGQSSDMPIPADYDGDGKADIAVRRPSSGYQFIYLSSDKTIERTYFGSGASAVPLALPVGLRSYFEGADSSQSPFEDKGILFSDTQEVLSTD